MALELDGTNRSLVYRVRKGVEIVWRNWFWYGRGSCYVSKGSWLTDISVVLYTVPGLARSFAEPGNHEILQ